MLGSLFPTKHRIPSDLERVLDLEADDLDGEALADQWTDRLAVTNARLRPIQAIALEVVSRYKCLFGSIGVGHGKTLICLLAGAAAGARRPLLLVPPALVEQMKTEAKTWSALFRFVPPRVVSYGILSTKKGSTLLEEIKPDLIIADECHALRHKTSARTKRILRYFREHPTAGFVGVSGTITSKSLLDYAHLLELSLRDRAPIPLSRFGAGGLESWASILDVNGEATKEDFSAFWPLVRWSGGSDYMPDKPTERKALARRAFSKRLASTPGVVCTVVSSCEASLHVVEHYPNPSDAVRGALTTLSTRWETPEGEPLADASAFARVAKQLSLGFYYRWEWQGEPDLVWLERRRAWIRAVSRVLRYSAREGLDSPALVDQWVASGRGNKETRAAWHAWQEVKHRPAPEIVPVWIDRSIMLYAVDWLAALDEPAIIWYRSKAVGEALFDLGLPVYGSASSCPSTDPRYPHKIGASIAVHGKGRNLQAYRLGLVLEPPGGASFEQLIGRYHRQGQKADLVEFHVLQHTEPLKKALTRARADALYIEQTTNQKQKLNFARYLRA